MNFFPGELCCSLHIAIDLMLVSMASILFYRPNFLIFDEPTNHLDVETVDALGKALNKFPVIAFLFVIIIHRANKNNDLNVHTTCMYIPST